MKKYLFRAMALLMVCCLLFAGCTPTDNGESTTTESTTTSSTGEPTSTEGTTSTTESTTTENTSASTQASQSTTSTTKGSSATTTKSTTKAPTTTKSTTKATTTKSTTKSTTKATTTKSTTSTTESTTVTTTKPTLSKAELKKLRDQVGFGYYRMGDLPFVALPAIEKEASKGHINFWATSFGRASTYLAKADELGDEYMVWLGIFDTIFTVSSSGAFTNYGWQDAVRENMQAIEDEGLMDHVIGFYFDEPLLCGASRKDFIEVTKFLRETYPDLRMFVVFAVNAIDPKVWSTGKDTVIDKETTKYLTDVGYDMYWDVTPSTIPVYESLNNTLRANSPADARMWYVPCIMSYGGTGKESFSIAHLNMCYDFLKKEKNPGGLYCYAYDISNRDGSLGNVGYSEMQSQWTNLEKRLVEVGKEIKSWNK